ncbi:MAG: aldehyde dehydrogenase family protein [Spirochaetota bacterium]
MQMLIDSELKHASDDEVIEVFNPATGEKIDTVPKGNLSDIKQAVYAAQQARERMCRMPAYERANILYKTAQSMEDMREELARLLTQENGKPITQTREEMNAAIRIFRGFAEESKRLFGRASSLDMVQGMEKHFAVTIRQPVGVVAAIVPFNYPVELYSHKAAAALAAGNAVIVKPPSDCPLALLKIAMLIEDAGIPRAAHQMVTGSGELIGEFLAQSHDIQMITLTGSAEAGTRVSELAANSLKKVHLELGGNDPMIICADADLEKAADAVILGRLARGNGQICCAVKRVLVDSEVYNNFSEILAEKTGALKVGDPMEEETDVGPVINEKAAIRVESRIKEAVENGAKLTTGGNRHGAFIDPAVLINVPADTGLFCEETFGPVAPLVSFKSIEDAVDMANHSPYGLQSAVFTNDFSRALNIAYRLNAGGVIVNWSSAVRVENLPFGGVKMSGHGRESIHDTLLEMTEQKSVLLYDVLSVFHSP